MPTRRAREQGRRVHELDARRDDLHQERHRVDQPRGLRVGPRERAAPDDLVVITQMEHHANIVPWQLLGLPAGVRARCTDDGLLDLDVLDELLAQGPKLVAVGHVSNVARARSTRSPRSSSARTRPARSCWSTARRPCRRCRSTSPRSAPTSTPGPATRPTGRPASACCTAARELLRDMPPFLGGGHMISRVGDFESTWAEAPHEVRGGHDAGGRGDRPRRRASTGFPGSAWTPCASTAATSRPTRSSGSPRCRPDAPRHARQ